MINDKIRNEFLDKLSPNRRAALPVGAVRAS